MLMFANCNGEPVNQTARINSDAHVIDRRPILVPSFSHNVTLQLCVIINVLYYSNLHLGCNTSYNNGPLSF